jgi:hypothetical protein
MSVKPGQAQSALAKRGWSISAIARHVGRDRKTVRAYLRGDRTPGQRRPAKPDDFEPFVAYVRVRFDEDPHLWATTLFDELVGLGFARSYPSFTRQLRARQHRPRCEACAGVKGRATIDIDDPPGEEAYVAFRIATRRPAGARCPRHPGP